MYVSGMGVDRTLIDSRISDSQFPNCFLAMALSILQSQGNLTGNLFYSQELLILADLEGRYLTLTYYSLAMPRKTHIVSSFRV